MMKLHVTQALNASQRKRSTSWNMTLQPLTWSTADSAQTKKALNIVKNCFLTWERGELDIWLSTISQIQANFSFLRPAPISTNTLLYVIPIQQGKHYEVQHWNVCCCMLQLNLPHYLHKPPGAHGYTLHITPHGYRVEGCQWQTPGKCPRGAHNPNYNYMQLG